MIKAYLRGDKNFVKKRFFIIATISLLLFIAIMRYLDGFLITENSANGIISFELAKDMVRSREIMTAWNATARSAAGISLGLDFIFLVIYSSFIAALIGVLNDRLWQNHSFYFIGKLLVIAIFGAAFMDVIENIALIKILLGSHDELWSLIAFYFASLKFIIILICIIYIFINSLLILFKK